MEQLTPRQIVQELDRHIIGQHDAKRAVAIALRNRWRRMQIEPELRQEVMPKNILMIGPTGVGKTEIARRLSTIADAPFIKVEATKFTEVGYVGKEVDSIIRDLTAISFKKLSERRIKENMEKAKKIADEKVLDALMPGSHEDEDDDDLGFMLGGSDIGDPDDDAEDAVTEEEPADGKSDGSSEKPQESSEQSREDAETREMLRKKLEAGELDDKEIEIRLPSRKVNVEIMSPPGMEDMSEQLQSIFENIEKKRTERVRVKVGEAREQLAKDAAEHMVDRTDLSKQTIEAVENNGIVFIDEIDKICGGGGEKNGPNVSREGVQRDLLPLIEGCSVKTKYGMVKTDHILFITSGAFQVSKPSDLIPELQGRLPIRVELKALTVEDFKKILTEPHASITEQYTALLRTEGVELRFTDDALQSIAEAAFKVNESTENIGARRLQTIMERLVDEISFDAPERKGETVTIDSTYVHEHLGKLVEDEDLSRYIL
ncbi:MAG: ATP-dependent protease ATPase subunit HslU [Succinivibrionaceae bacterium]|nr:ATP-dependent protease ATPase subunit HslU [Pseudomonadota bacterium]MDD6545170.1 ATP-dependent protease ATPase subunit HslU [Pseudomonadota bacterium]MDY3143898.1 ATP-dependent protease ATPase subunit HslU [Succinivibrionaceae bacterium]MDY6273998.1 ATP-dependent protease ATPase subunit HslU [Succinivibrionaceae bacterium]MDY6374669.1 ATP-dependent protease ATPase subunit HslU [Succinivibrionaceae bacterium]